MRIEFHELINLVLDVQNELYRYYAEIKRIVDMDIEDQFTSIDIGKTPLKAVFGLIRHKMSVKDWEIIVDRFREVYIVFHIHRNIQITDIFII